MRRNIEDFELLNTRLIDELLTPADRAGNQ